MNSLTDKIIRYEDGDLEFNDTIELFQELINSGLAWQLQGHYGRTAQMLIEDGLCTLSKEESMNVCPRCNQEYTGFPALSRVDNKTEICSDCGTQEALDDYYGTPLVDFTKENENAEQ